METTQSVPKSLEELKKEQSEVASQIMGLDAKGDKGEAWQKLKAHHEELTAMIEDMPNEDELHKKT
ncbi:MAG: hypothetical protein ABI643_01125 [Candidatus Doudnabacteria bacterium]